MGRRPPGPRRSGGAGFRGSAAATASQTLRTARAQSFQGRQANSNAESDPPRCCCIPSWCDTDVSFEEGAEVALVIEASRWCNLDRRQAL